MPTVLLVRHGRSTANAAGRLAGWTPGVGLDDAGRAQATALAARFAGVRVRTVVTSPLQRCQETAAVLRAAGGLPAAVVDDRLGEVRYGDWQGRELCSLAHEPLWRTVQQHPSGVTFPGFGGESLRAVQARALDAVRGWDARIGAVHGATACWVAVSHGDVIKAIVADALGVHLDAFQRIVVDPCAVCVVTYTPLRPFVVRVNDTGGPLVDAVPRRRRRGPRAADAEVGGSTGAGA